MKATRTWEIILVFLLLIVVAGFSATTEGFLDFYNLSDSTFNYSEKALIALVMLVPLKSYEPYMVVVDKATGFVEVKRPMAEGVLNQDEAVTTFNVVRYIRMRETYDPKALKENFEIAQLLATAGLRWRNQVGEAAGKRIELLQVDHP